METVTGNTTTGLTDAEVAARVERGEVNRVPRTTSRTVGQIVRANVLTPFNALLGGLLVLILIVGPDPGRAVRRRARRQRGHRHRPGAPGEADARPARPAHRAPRHGWSATARSARSAVDDVVLGRRARAARPATRCAVDGVVLDGPAWRSTSRCSPASPTPWSSSRATRCSPGASWPPGTGAVRATGVGAGCLRPRSSPREAQPIHPRPLRAARRHRPDPAARHLGDAARWPRC